MSNLKDIIEATLNISLGILGDDALTKVALYIKELEYFEASNGCFESLNNKLVIKDVSQFKNIMWQFQTIWIHIIQECQ